MIHFAFPSIDQFHNTRRAIQLRSQFVGKDSNGDPIYDNTAISPKILYKGSVKLHGTNAAIVIDPHKGEFYAQSRENVITPEKDNAGFAKFVASFSLDQIDQLLSNLPQHWEDNQQKVVIFGEWAGKGIQSNVAISQLDRNFYIFAARYAKDDEQDNEKESWIDIQSWTNLPKNIKNVEHFQKFDVEIDFEHPERMVNQINEWVLQVEAECPIAKELGVSGIGEGIVWQPYNSPGFMESRFWFKTKGSLHSKSKVTKLATVDVEKVESLQAFVNSVLEEGRMEQGFQKLKEQGLPQDQTSTGKFLSWVVADVIKENKREMEVNGILEKDIGKHIQLPARRWFFDRITRN